MKKSILTKFKGINYPIFVLRKKPYEFVYSSNTISCRINRLDSLQTIDNKSLAGDYFARLIQLEDRVAFYRTCKNLQELILSKAEWGIDYKALPHDLSKRVAVPVEKREVTKVQGRLIWVRNISYPFEISTNEIISLQDKLYATMIHVNEEWFIREFSLDSFLKRPYMHI